MLEEEARRVGDPRPVSKYDWISYTEKITLGLYSTNQTLIITSDQKDKNGCYILARYYSDENATKDYDKYGFPVYFANEPYENPVQINVVICISAREFILDRKRTTKDDLYIIVRDFHCQAQYDFLGSLPKYPKTPYGSIDDALNHYQDLGRRRFFTEVLNSISKEVRSTKRNYFGFDDVNFERVFFDFYDKNNNRLSTKMYKSNGGVYR